MFLQSRKEALEQGIAGNGENGDKVKSAWNALNDTAKDYWKTEDFRFQVWCEDPICDDDTEILYQHQCVKYNLKLTETTTVTLNGNIYIFDSKIPASLNIEISPQRHPTTELNFAF